MVQVRPEGPKAHSPGQWTQAVRLKGQKLLAQGSALGYHVRKLGAL